MSSMLKNFIYKTLGRGFDKGESGSGEEKINMLMRNAVVVEPSGIKKGALDERNYRFVTLENQLEVLLISDPKAETSGAALSVNAGSFSDPENLPGLAHFLEHMLFMGTEKYPVESEYSKFLADHGGYSNAYTAREETNYQFVVMSSKLYEALDRFAQFFIAPLFTESGTDRELNAVDNECTGNLQNDGWRLFLVFCELINIGHPGHKFNIGNLETLRFTPEKEKINVREALFKFHNDYYSANRMKLCIIGQDDLDVLQKNVENIFTPVENKNYETPYKFPNNVPAFSPGKNLGVKVSIVPVQDIRKVEIIWAFPPVNRQRKNEDSPRFLSALLGDEGKGSVLALLKKLNWANGLSCGLNDNNFDFSTMELSIDCTDVGISQHVDDIVSIVYSYISMLKETYDEKKYFFEEEKIINIIQFWFKPQQEPFRYVTGLASKMQSDVPRTDILTSTNIFFDDDKNLSQFRTMLELLTPENSITFVSWKQFEGKTDKTEQWFKTKYSVEHLTPELIKFYLSDETYKPQLDFTPHNEFIPDNFGILPFEKPKVVKVSDAASKLLKTSEESIVIQSLRNFNHNNIPDKRAVALDVLERDVSTVWNDMDTWRKPVIIAGDEVSTLWYKQDMTFKTPKATVRLFLKNKLLNENARTAALSSLYISLVLDELNAVTYPAMQAGFSHEISFENNGFVLSFIGFSATLQLYINLVCEKFITYGKGEINTDQFERFKEKKIKDIQNLEKSRPVSLARMAISEAITEKARTIEELLQARLDLSVDALRAFVPSMFDEMSIEMLVFGNILQKEAVDCFNVAKDLFLKAKSNPEFEFLRTVNLPSRSQTFFISKYRDEENPNSGLCVTFSFGEFSKEKQALLRVFDEIASERFFNQVRTKETLGYVVYATSGMENGVLTYSFYVESNKADPIYLNERVEAFIDLLYTKFFFDTDPNAPNYKENDPDSPFVTNEIFDKVVNAVINNILSKAKTLQVEEAKWFGVIKSNLYQFNSAVEGANTLAKLSLEDLKTLLGDFLWKDAPSRAKFVSGVLAKVHISKMLYGDVEDEAAQKTFEPEELKKEIMNKIESIKDAPYVKDRGDVVVAEDTILFRENSKYGPTFEQILESKL